MQFPSVFLLTFINLCILLPYSARAELPVLLSDIENSPKSSVYPYEIMYSNSLTFFINDDGEHGFELWRTDGTADGTYMVADIYPGPGNSQPYALTNFNAQLYFIAQEPGFGRALFKSDGTSIARVKSIHTELQFGFKQILGTADQKIILSGNDGIGGEELWISDGTEAGTQLVKEMSPGAYIRREIGEINGRLVFEVLDFSNNGNEPWVTDGTEEGTKILMNIAAGAGSSQPYFAGTNSEYLYFFAQDYIVGNELYRTDGTPEGTELFADIRPGPESSNGYPLGKIEEDVFFAASDVIGATAFWKVDGQTGALIKVKDLRLGPSGRVTAYALTAEKTLFFSAFSEEYGNELYKSDGTAFGTQLVRDILPGSRSGLFDPSLAALGGDRILFRARDDEHGDELWISDGTKSRTTLIKDIFSGRGSSSPFNFQSIGQAALFFAKDGDLNTALYRTDGTAPGTYKILDLVQSDHTADSIPGNFIAAGDQTCFSAALPGFYKGILCTSNYSSAPLVINRDLRYVSDMVAPEFLNGDLLISGLLADGSDADLYRIDRSKGTLKPVKDTRPGNPAALISKFVEVGEQVFFISASTSTRWDLWITDGSGLGTVNLTKFMVNVNIGSLALFPFKDGVIFVASDVGNGNFEPWYSDGTVRGTRKITEVHPGNVGSVDYDFKPYIIGDEFFFTATSGNGSDNYFLFRSDGTASGTFQLTNLPGSGAGAGIDRGSMAKLNENLIFGCRINVSFPYGTSELCKTTEAPEGAEIVKEFIPGSGISQGGAPDRFVSAGAYVFFFAKTVEFGREPWITDGTEAGTIMLKDIYPGSRDSDDVFSNYVFGQPIAVNGYVYFRAVDDTHGAQVWRTDGTPEGTVVLLPPDDIHLDLPGRTYNPRLVNGKLYLNRFSLTYGMEPFVITPPLSWSPAALVSLP